MQCVTYLYMSIYIVAYSLNTKSHIHFFAISHDKLEFHGSVWLQKCDVIASLSANGSTAFKGMLCCHWLIGFWQRHITRLLKLLLRKPFDKRFRGETVAEMDGTACINVSCCDTYIQDLYGFLGSVGMFYHMMTSSDGNIFRVTDRLWGETTGHWWITPTKASNAELWCVLCCVPEQTPDQTVDMPVIWDTMVLIITPL